MSIQLLPHNFRIFFTKMYNTIYILYIYTLVAIGWAEGGLSPEISKKNHIKKGKFP